MAIIKCIGFDRFNYYHKVHNEKQQQQLEIDPINLNDSPESNTVRAFFYEIFTYYSGGRVPKKEKNKHTIEFEFEFNFK